MEPLQLKRRAASRVRTSSAPIIGLGSQEARLTNGCYGVRLTAVGSGLSECGDVAVSRWLPDRTSDADGFHVFLRDPDDNFLWSAGYQPTRIAAESYEFHGSPSLAEIVRTDRDIECRLAVCVAPSHDFELRGCRLTNHGTEPRRIELTSYVEFVLAPREADANHPAFLKLFIETEFRPEANAILARRRPRSANEPERWAFHRLLMESNGVVPEVQFETNRLAFIGRGRTLGRARAFDPGAVLTSSFGPVLDPIGSLRTVTSLAPGETSEVVFVLGAATGRETLEVLLAAAGDFSHMSEILAAAESTAAAGNGDVVRWNLHPAHEGPSSRRRPKEPQRQYSPAAEVVRELDQPRPEAIEELQFANSHGGFTADGREYVIRLEADARGHLRLPPQPWVNVLANEQAGCIVSERGAGYTWAGNSRHNRLTAWHNDPVCDPHGESCWLRDEEAEVFWSPLPGPTPSDSAYEVRHGFGYTTFRHESLGLAQEVTVFMAVDDPVKLVRLRLVNDSQMARRLTAFSFLQWNLGTLAEDADAISTEYDDAITAIFARNPQREVYRECVAFSAVVADPARSAVISHTGDREAFLGRQGDSAAPLAVVAGEKLDNRTGRGLDPCAAWQVPIDVPAGGAVECVFLLGEAANRNAAAGLIQKYRQPGQPQQAFDQVVAFWRETLSAIQIETPDREIDLLVNGWLAYQNLSCRMWARSAYYQPGGAFGFRDQLQDAAALVFHRPDVTRQQILRHAAQQFVEGDVMHWWHADTGRGLRTRFSDDLAWLPYVTTAYIRATGDEALLDETAPFVTAETLAEGQQELYLAGAPSGESATIYEHCCRALDRALTTGEHGLPLIGCGDWNDGMNRVGQQGRGESVWLGFFLHSVLEKTIPICRRRGDQPRVERYVDYQARVAEALNAAGWDGGWYRRAYYDNGEPLGSATSDECQIDALAQAWAVLSGVAPPERAAAAMRAAEERLVDDDCGLIRLLTPPLDTTPNDPGYIKGYVPGVRENGGQYTHGVLWFVRALAEMGRGTRAVELLRMLSPVTRTATAERAAIYQTEPYVVAADVYGEPPHVGRGGWTWYTGSAGWMWRVAVESILGLSIDGGTTLVIRPAISSAWPRCKLFYRLPGETTCYEISIENPAGKETGVMSATLDGQPADVVEGAARVAIQRDGKMHSVVVRL
jgi:cyclic beta-1,2-glucan synthetase